MRSRLIIDGNTVYEIDDECVRRKQSEQDARKEQIQKSKFLRESKSYQR